MAVAAAAAPPASGNEVFTMMVKSGAAVRTDARQAASTQP
jgi:hypothetical protein